MVCGDGFYEEDETIFTGSRERMKLQRKYFREIQESQGFSPGSSIFWNSFRMSTDILLVDKFFCEKSYKRVFWELNKAFNARDKKKKRIKIFCEDYYKKIRQMHSDYDKENRSLFVDFRVEIHCLTMQNATHDRFAIMDQEIWHCGAAVGGMYHGLSALSRGWKDENDCLKKYFCGEEG